MDQRVEMGRVLGDWKRSGLSLREFGRRKGFAYTKLVYWRRKLDAETPEQENRAAGRPGPLAARAGGAEPDR